MGLAKNYRTGGKLTGRPGKRRIDPQGLEVVHPAKGRGTTSRAQDVKQKDSRAIPIGGTAKGMPSGASRGTGTFKNTGSTGTYTAAGETPPAINSGSTATPDYTGGTVPSQGQAQPEPATPDITGSFDHSLRATTSASMGGNPGFSSSARSGGLSKMLKRKPGKIKIRRAAGGHRFY